MELKIEVHFSVDVELLGDVFTLTNNCCCVIGRIVG